MYIPGKRCEISDTPHMLLPVPMAPVKVGDTPPLRDVEPEQLRQFRGLRLCDGVPPGAEFDQLLPISVKGQVAVHHGGKAHSARPLQRRAVLFLHLQGHLL